MAVTRTPLVPNPGAVAVAISAGQFLHFILEAGGPIPIFSFASSVKGVLFEAPDFPGHPTTRYEWLHLKNPSDIQQLELLNLGLSFLTNADYTYTVELLDATSAVVSTVLQVKYNGAPIDTTSESFTVVLS
jgi:hypothetical protein